MDTDLPFSQACENNKGPILEILKRVFDRPARVLEIGTGTAQHAVHFAASLPHLHWQPSDQIDWHEQGAERLRRHQSANMASLIELDVRNDLHWRTLQADHAYSANTAHFMAWESVECMFAGIGSVLPTSGCFVLYGPFNENGRYTSESNEAFDAFLRERDPSFGIRDIRQLESLAETNRMTLHQRHTMPANNQILVFKRCD